MLGISYTDHKTSEHIGTMATAEESRVNYGGSTLINGQTSHYRRCCAPQTTEDEDLPLQRKGLSEYPQRRLGGNGR